MAKAKPDTPKDAKSTKQSTLAGFFGPPKSSPKINSPRPSQNNGTSTTNIRAPSSAAGSSPLVPSASARIPRPSSPMKKNIHSIDIASEDDLTPPPDSGPSSTKTVTGSTTMMTSRMDVDGEENAEDNVVGDGSPVFTGRRAKRKTVVYAETDSDASSGEDLSQPKARSAKGRRPRKSMREDSEEFVFDEADDAAMIAAAEEYEVTMVSRSPSPAGSASVSPPPKRKGGFVPPKTVPKKATTSWRASSPAGPSAQPVSRPGPKPLAGSSSKIGSNRSHNESSDWQKTRAEIKREEARRKKEEEKQPFSFTEEENIRDQEKRRPDHPDYDKRTLHIPKDKFNDLKDFEKQFWRIKQQHYDTVLFFQKGKFFELYENDAMIGHQEFDLKLTDRVQMKMVGVPEQSLEMWTAKFIGAGYKVGIVRQAETAVGARMRNEGRKASNEDKMVRRELAQVFTNGTIVDDVYLNSADANYCVSIKERLSERTGLPAFGICKCDASRGHFDLSAFEDDVIFTRLETYFRQIRPKELIYAKGNLSAETTRLLRNVLPANTSWEPFRDGHEFCTPDETLNLLASKYETAEDPSNGAKPLLPDEIAGMLEEPLAMEALGGLLAYLDTLNLAKDLISQRNFNIYDPIKEGKSLVLDGPTLRHMEVLVNSEGGLDGTLLRLLQRTITPFGTRLFRFWLQSPLRDVGLINARLDAVDDLINHPEFVTEFNGLKRLPDLERLISRIHAGDMKQIKFLEVVQAFKDIKSKLVRLKRIAEGFASDSIPVLLQTAPDLSGHLIDVEDTYENKPSDDGKTFELVPKEGKDPECDEADEKVEGIEKQLQKALVKALKSLDLDTRGAKFWNSAQGGKEIRQIPVPVDVKVPRDWTKASGTQKESRYYTPDTIPLIRELQEAKEVQNTVKANFFIRLLRKFDHSRTQWLQAVKTLAELDCLVSLAKASNDMNEPKCRPTFEDLPVDSAFLDFEELRHPSMCLRADFIPNNVQLGDRDQPRQILLTGPNMAGKSTLLRMTAAGVILAQMGCYVPAAKARLSPVDRIQTRMGAYDNMFASASTFKVELDECARILREAGPRSLVILDELGRGTSTYDGMAIAGAVLHHLATHTLPLGFFATHYGSLTDDFAYHPNIRNMHMQTYVDDEQRQVVFLYKLIAGVAESSHGTHVARMAGVPQDVVIRAESVSLQFQQNFNEKLASRRKSKLPLVAQADFAWLMRIAGAIDPLPEAEAEPGTGQSGEGEITTIDNDDDDGEQGVIKKREIKKTKAGLKEQLEIIKRAIDRYAIKN